MPNTMQSMFQLDGKVALVTGASRGIGASIARGLAEFGARVVLCGRHQETLDNVAGEFDESGLEATGIAANMGNIDDIQALVERSVGVYGGLDIIVNNAAANPVFGPLQDTEQRAFDKIIDVNLKGPFELCKLAYPILKARDGGSIIHIGSIGGHKPEPDIGIYSVSKAAIISLTKAMAQDWGADNIRVNAICPGLIRTRFSEALWLDDKVSERFETNIPLGRIGEPEDIAGLAVFLASNASSYCSGACYLVDGGYSIN